MNRSSPTREHQTECSAQSELIIFLFLRNFDRCGNHEGMRLNHFILKFETLILGIVMEMAWNSIGDEAK
jgi:hypothetical protein